MSHLLGDQQKVVTRQIVWWSWWL